jgi:hypothetical protein
VTAAFGRTAPVGSMTVPEMVAVVVAICACMGGAIPVHTANRTGIAPNRRNRCIQLFLVINV